MFVINFLLPGAFYYVENRDLVAKHQHCDIIGSTCVGCRPCCVTMSILVDKVMLPNGVIEHTTSVGIMESDLTQRRSGAVP